ncbi:hypothetical protein [Clavibacter sp. Sh2088]|uniref:hypothetical protein n=1 Tax=Clavibacter sp. Sh2088 TaxID=3397676 RepID=UPI0039E01B86
MDPHERADPGADPGAGSVDPARAELAELRRRAYGPGRDADPADLKRLRVLEGRATARPVTPAPPAVEPAPVDPASPDAVDHVDEAPVHPDPASSRPRRRLAVLWAASLVGAVALTAVVVSAVSAPPGREVAVVRFDPDQDLPVYMRDYFGGAETGSARFHGLTLVRLEGDRSASPRIRGECLAIQPARAALSSTEGGGCAAGAFGASAQFVVNVGAPEELREVYPVGTALLFDLRGDAVHVRVDDSVRVPSPTRPPT